jgi:hypothetical protein
MTLAIHDKIKISLKMKILTTKMILLKRSNLTMKMIVVMIQCKEILNKSRNNKN